MMHLSQADAGLITAVSIVLVRLLLIDPLHVLLLMKSRIRLLPLWWLLLHLALERVIGLLLGKARGQLCLCTTRLILHLHLHLLR